jgi:hypothetical protein
MAHPGPLATSVIALACVVGVGCGDEPATCPGERELDEGGGLLECDGEAVHRAANAPCSNGDGCIDDFSCGPAEVCSCNHEGRGACVAANCNTDQDCGDQLCFRSWDACGTKGFFCATPEDECSAGMWGCVYWESRSKWDTGGAAGCP